MLRELFLQLPIIGRFALIFGLIVLLPRLAERFRLPGVVGLLAGGILLGPELLGLVDPKSGTIVLFSELGKLLLMFFAGYEVDLSQFRRIRLQASGFGLMTFGFPLAFGTGVGQLFGYSLNASILIGSLLASHTLLALPSLREKSLMDHDAVVVTVGATIFTDIAAMLVLAVCLPIHTSGFSTEQFTLTLFELAVYVPLIIFGLSSFVRWLVKTFHFGAELKLAILLLMIAIAALAAEAIHLEGIVGAFLTGIAVKRALGETKGEGPLSIISHTLFIPVFFLSTGFLVDLQAFILTLFGDFVLVVAVIGSLLAAKYLAAQGAGILFRMNEADRVLMWSLSLPQVAATLAAALVAYEAIDSSGVRLIDDRMLNVIVVLVLASSVVGPVVTRRVALRLASD